MWGNIKRYKVPTPGVNVGSLYLQFFVREWRLGMKMFFIWLIEDDDQKGDCKKVFSFCNIICFAKSSFDSFVLLLFIANFRLHCSI